MTTLKDLERKYSGQQIPQWELDALQPKQIEQPKQRKPRAKKDSEPNGNFSPDMH